MREIQHTIRNLPVAIDNALRRRAGKEGKSLNTVMIETLARGLERDSKPKAHTDLDNLIGTWQEDPAFDEAIADFRCIEKIACK
jgi:plasmid stability protein